MWDSIKVNTIQVIHILIKCNLAIIEKRLNKSLCCLGHIFNFESPMKRKDCYFIYGGGVV